MNLIESERLYVRHFTMDDLDNFFRLSGDEEVMRYIRPVQSLEETAVFLKEIIANYEKWPHNLRLALFQKDIHLFTGSFAIIPVENTAEIQLGYSLLKEYWGKGYATEIVKAGLAFAFNELGLAEIAAITETGNTASQKVLLKNGFVLSKTFTDKAGKILNKYRGIK